VAHEGYVHVCAGRAGRPRRRAGLTPPPRVVPPDAPPFLPRGPRLAEFYTRFAGRSDLLKYAAEKDIPVTQTVEKPWSTDENMYHISYEAGMLEVRGAPRRAAPRRARCIAAAVS